MRNGMIYNPYPYSFPKQVLPFDPKQTSIPLRIQEFTGGRWVHHPITKAISATKGAGLGTAVATGNFLTRNYRQKPIVGLQTYGKNIVRINTPKNKILPNSKAMPYKKTKSTKTTYRRKGKKGTRPRRRRTLPPLTLPRSRVVRFRLVTTTSFTSTTGTLAAIALKANSLNDPTINWSASLPLSLDQWAAQYTKYIVLGSKLTIKASPTTQTGPAILGIHLADNGTGLTSASHYKELPLTTQRILTTQRDLVTISMKYAGKRFWKINNIKDDSEQEADFSVTPGDPNDLAYFHVYLHDMYGSHTVTCDLQCEMEFICLLTNPVQLAQSSL